MKLSRNSVRSTHIKNGQVKKADLARTGERGPQGAAGPSAAKLVLDQPATGGSTLEPFAAVGPWEFASICSLVGGEEVVASLRVRGGTAAEYQLAAVEAFSDTTHTHKTTGGSVSPAGQAPRGRSC